MSDKKLNFTSSLFVSSMLFGLFFGAGNLILPVQVGQNSGSNFIPAVLGFVFTAAGLPFLAVSAFGASRTEDVYSMGKMVNEKYSKVLTILLYLTIGPLFALPRTCTVAFEVGYANLANQGNKNFHLFIFSLLFFSVALYFALRPNKILIWVGKILNPIFLAFFFILFINAVLKPMGPISKEIYTGYDTAPFFKGFTEGYQTMDLLAALAFGSIVTKTIIDLDIDNPKRISLETFKSGLFSGLLMAIIYIALSWLGSTVLNVVPPSENGGIALARISNHYFGNFGSIFLAITVTVACLKTAIGLIVACSDIFHKHLPIKNAPLKYYTIGITIFTAGVANFGLSKLIELAVPILMLLYPLCMTLVILGLLTPWINDKKSVYVSATIGASIMAVFDMLYSSPEFIKNLPIIRQSLDFCVSYIPLFKIGMSWIVPTLIGFIIGFIIDNRKKTYN